MSEFETVGFLAVGPSIEGRTVRKAVGRPPSEAEMAARLKRLLHSPMARELKLGFGLSDGVTEESFGPHYSPGPRHRR
jgi:hypothetical protein